MEAKDLMIGDLVRVNRDVCIKNDTIVRVCGIDATNRLVEKGLEGSATCVPVDDIDFYSGGIWVKYLSPIPLTPEILEKNGFYLGNTASEEDFCSAVGCGYPDSGWCFDEGAGEIKIIFPNETDGGLIRLDDQSGDRHLELVFVEPIMVYELQHCLKLVGIDKEINL